MTDSNPPRTPEPHLELVHVHYTETGFRAEHATLMALAG